MRVVREVQLVRHGESEANAGRSVSDACSAPLTERGLEQVGRLAVGLSPSPDLVICSDMVRARQTAKVILLHHPEAHAATWPVDEFTPLAKLAYAGTTVAQRAAATRAYWMRSDPWAVAGPGAESFGQLMERAAGTLNRLTSQPTDRVVLVSHRKFLTTLLWIALTGDDRVSRRRMQRYRAFDQALRLPNASLVRLSWRSDRAWIGSIERFDRVQH